MAGTTPTSQSTRRVLELDANSRTLVGVSMPPLLTGEFKLLSHLGSKPDIWHSARLLSRRVFEREDPAAIQLIWKYVSTLRNKLASSQVSIIETCRRRGYRCPLDIYTTGDEFTALREQR